jgi:hypothetical protein
MILEILNFIFQDFWHWLGTFLLLGVVSNAFTGLIRIKVPSANSNCSGYQPDPPQGGSGVPPRKP